jgi:hypothetical protein
MTDEFKNLVVVGAVLFVLWHFFGKKACCAACASGKGQGKPGTWQPGPQPGGQSHPRSTDLRSPNKQPCGCAPYAAYGG